jgi:LCP family protein required for cell wall assembly
MGSLPPPFVQAPRRRRNPALRVLLLCFLTGVGLVPVVAGAGLYFLLTGTFDARSLEGLVAPLAERLAPVVGTERQSEQPVPAAPPSAPEPEWTGRDKVNILLLGSDHREGDPDIPRTDTIIVLTIDTASRTAGLLSLPRDLWVVIPGHGEDRINAAFELGEARQRGGGPDLTRRTVEQLLGVPIHHYVLVGFAGFSRLVDEIGGVTIDVERPIKDDEYPDANYSTRRIYFQPGLQRMSGETALWYVRTRHADSDFGRARRQQQFLLALRHQALQLNLLPKAPALLSALSDTFKTDFKPHEILGLARVAREVDTSRVQNRVIDESMTSHRVTSSGAQVEIPDRAAVRKVVQEVFGPR